MALDPSRLPPSLRRRFGSDVQEASAAVIAEPWEANRKYGIVIDAGSSGSRLQIYSWKDTVNTAELLARFGKLGNVTRDSLPVIEKGDEDGQDWQYRVEPGGLAFTSSEVRLKLTNLCFYQGSRRLVQSRTSFPRI